MIVRRGGPLLFAYDAIAHTSPNSKHNNFNDDLHYAIDSATLRTSEVRARRVFGTPVMRRMLAVAACPVEWKNRWDAPEAVVNEPGRVVCVGAVRNLTLTAYAVNGVAREGEVGADMNA